MYADTLKYIWTAEVTGNMSYWAVCRVLFDVTNYELTGVQVHTNQKNQIQGHSKPFTFIPI